MYSIRIVIFLLYISKFLTSSPDLSDTIEALLFFLVATTFRCSTLAVFSFIIAGGNGARRFFNVRWYVPLVFAEEHVDDKELVEPRKLNSLDRDSDEALP